MSKLTANGLRNNLAEARKSVGMTQDELARAVDVSRQTVSAMEQGNYNPSATLALRLAALFNVPVEHLFALEHDVRTEFETRGRRLRELPSKGDVG